MRVGTIILFGVCGLVVASLLSLPVNAAPAANAGAMDAPAPAVCVMGGDTPPAIVSGDDLSLAALSVIIRRHTKGVIPGFQEFHEIGSGRYYYRGVFLRKGNLWRCDFRGLEWQKMRGFRGTKIRVF